MNIETELNNIKTKNILVIGDIMLDKYYFGDSKRLSPEAPVPVLKKKSEKIVLGGAANVATNLIKAGQNVSIMSVIGKDKDGEALEKKLKSNNINTDLLMIDESRRTTVKTRMIGQNNAQMLRVDIEDSEDISIELSDKMLEKFKENVRNYDIIIISDYKKGLLNVRNTAKIIEIANLNRKRTLVDTKEPSYNKYKDAYVIKPNLEELHQLTNMSVNSDEEIVKAATELKNQTGAKYVLATRGKDGMTLVSDNEFKHVKSASKEVYDVSGAGDTVISYLAVCLVNDLNIEDAVKISNMAAGVEVSKMGTYAVSIEEIKKYINEENDVKFEEKMPNLENLLKILKEKKNQGKKIVFTNGCFDIFHVGHSRYLRKASTYGDILIVGINSDDSVRRIKGQERPIVSENERMELIASLECVSYVVKFNEDTPYELIKMIMPDIITKGGDYKEDDVVGGDIVKENGGEVIICPFIEGKSTTNIIKKIRKEN